MTQVVSDEVLGKFARKQADWFRRVREGSLDPDAVSKVIQSVIDQPSNPYLRKIDTAKIKATKKAEVVTKCRNIFVYIDLDYKNWGLDKPSRDTPAGILDIYEMKEGKNGNFRTILGSLGDLDHLVTTQGQMIDFCENNRDKLRQGGYGTFFLLEREDGERFVAGVLVHGSGLSVFVVRLGHDGVWGGEDALRLVVPQLET